MTAETLNIRESNEVLERRVLHPLAAKSAESRGREQPDTPCDIRTAFQRDRDRILHSKAFRRLKHKTQVFISPAGDHYRTRLTHSLEVAQIARTIARALRLNEDLAESIALGHDLGHPPFGHTGERVLDELSPLGFHHQAQSLRIARMLENLNLTREVLDGMEGTTPDKIRFLTLEAQVVDLADRMAYLHHDAEDACRAGLMREADLPPGIIRTLGKTRQARLDRMVLDLIVTSRKNMEAALPGGFFAADGKAWRKAPQGNSRRDARNGACLDTGAGRRDDAPDSADGAPERLSEAARQFREYSLRLGRRSSEPAPACIDLTPEVREAMMALRRWMFEHVYLDPARQGQVDNVRRVLGALYGFYSHQPEALCSSLPPIAPDYPPERRVLDYIAGMTDRFAIEAFKRHLLPHPYQASPQPDELLAPGVPAMAPSLSDSLPEALP